MRRVSDLLPDVAERLGIRPELQAASRNHSWERLVARLVPPATGMCRITELRPPTLTVAVPDAATAQELRLRSSQLLDAFAEMPGGERITNLRVVVRQM